MKFKVDENLPAEIAGDLRTAGHEADTVSAEHLAGSDDLTLIGVTCFERRVLLTLDKGIANVARYPQASHAGVVLFRPGSAGRRTILQFVRSRLPQILELDLRNRLTVVSETRIRMR
jgi:predicted nuclease of predicted toxin-antitoxin system